MIEKILETLGLESQPPPKGPAREPEPHLIDPKSPALFRFEPQVVSGNF